MAFAPPPRRAEQQEEDDLPFWEEAGYEATWDEPGHGLQYGGHISEEKPEKELQHHSEMLQRRDSRPARTQPAQLPQPSPQPSPQPFQPFQASQASQASQISRRYSSPALPSSALKIKAAGRDRAATSLSLSPFSPATPLSPPTTATPSDPSDSSTWKAEKAEKADPVTEEPQGEETEELPKASGKRAAVSEPEKSKKAKKSSAVDMHVQALNSLKSEAEKEDYLGNITLTMRMKVAEALSQAQSVGESGDAAEAPQEPAEDPAEEPAAEPEIPQAGKSEKNEKKHGKGAKKEEEGKTRPKRAAAEQAEPEQVKKAKKFTPAVEKHMEELAKLKSEKAKQKYIANLTLSMQTKVSMAISEADVPEEAAEAPQPSPVKKRAPQGSKEPVGKARKVDNDQKHLEELAKIKTEKAKTAYLNKLPAQVRQRVEELRAASPRRLGPPTLIEVAEKVAAEARQTESAGAGNSARAEPSQKKPAPKKGKPSPAVEKHLQELNKLKNEQKKETYLNKLPAAMRMKMAEAMSLAGAGC
mmetsp:Transcript_51696/g.120640  ORF Transcript_51696/g.120640 Transcript_51696/m.120640 type:complete len:529 (-) Transcript_51696:215-1801(-)